MVRVPRCDICGEPITTCGGCYKVATYRSTRKFGIMDYECPNEKFEFEQDLYHDPSFKRKVYREKLRRANGYTTVDDQFEDEHSVPLDCPYCDTWFNVPVEYTNTKSASFTGQVECPFCFSICKIGKAGTLEKKDTDKEDEDEELQLLQDEIQALKG